MTFRRYFQFALVSLFAAITAFLYLNEQGMTTISNSTTISIFEDKHTVEAFVKNRISDPIYGVVTIDSIYVFRCEGATSVNVSFNENDSTLAITTNGELDEKNSKNILLKEFKDIKITHKTK